MKTSFRERLQQKKPLIGTILTLPSPAVAEMLADIGFDWLFIDGEHGAITTGEIQAILQATHDRCPCLVRIPANSEVFVKQALDIGAAGIIAPLVNTPEVATQIVSFAKYPPQGARSVGIARAHGYGRTFQQYLSSANEDTAVVVQIEHVEGVQNIEGILAVPGIDAIFLGPYDLSGSLGKPGMIGDPDVQNCINKVRDACQLKGMPLGIFGRDAAAVKPNIAEGYILVAVGTDTLFLAKSAESALMDIRR